MNKNLLKLGITSGFFFVCVTGAFSQPLSINTMAGQTNQGSADGFRGVAQFRHPNSLAANSVGIIYVADTENSTIRKIATNQVVSTFAGLAGNFGSSNGIGTNAQFYGPQGIAVDNAGTVYVADTANATIRKITAGGVVSTLAGSAGNINSFDGTGTNAQFFQPEGIAVDTFGNVFVSDTWNHTIRKITSAGVVSTVAGLAGESGSRDSTNSSKARFNRPSGIAVDGSNNIFVADSLNHTIRKIAPGGAVTTIAGWAGIWGSANGTNNAARFFQPQGIVIDNAGNLFVIDSGNQTVRKISPAGTNWVVTTVAGSLGTAGSADGTGSAAQFYFPAGIARDGAGYLFVADSGNNSIRSERPFVNFAVNTSINLSNSGTIAASPSQPMYNIGDSVLLTATANSGFRFVGWSGDIVTTNNPLTLTMTNNKTFVANFISMGLIVDNPQASYSGVWTTANAAPDKYGSYYQYAATVPGPSGIAEAIYTPNILTAGNYDVFVWYPQGTNRSTHTPVLIGFNGGNLSTNVDQTTGGGGWRLVAANKEFAQGTNGFVSIKNNTGEANRIVVADAVRFSSSLPIIYVQPQNQQVAFGSNATFVVLAATSGQISYQWQFNEADIPGATNSSYTKFNVQNGDVGGYAVVISNPGTSIVSDVAGLSLLPSNRFGSPSVLPDGRFHFSFSGNPGVSYTIESSTTLTNWTFVTNLSSADGILDFIEPLPKLQKQFYRTRTSP